MSRNALLSCLSLLSAPLIGGEPVKVVCESPQQAFHMKVKHTEQRKVGYTTVSGFGTSAITDSSFPFFDLRAHVFNDGKWGGTGGLGSRFILDSMNYLLGVHGYYDVRQDKHHFTTHQVSPGLELLGERMEYRINGYFPLGQRKKQIHHHQFDRFIDHHIGIKFHERNVFMGGDSEVGIHLMQNSPFDVYLGAGPYYLSASKAHAWGGRGRLLGRYNDYLSLEVAYSYDRCFKNDVQGRISLSMPLGGKLQKMGAACSNKTSLAFLRAPIPPHRLDIPSIKTITRHGLAINPRTLAPWNVWFVDNMSANSSSVGSFENRLSTLAAAAKMAGTNDMIYVFAGDGTPKGMDQGIHLQDGQFLLGAGTVQQIPTLEGDIFVPASSRALPLLTNSATASSGSNVYVVQLANHNRVSGIHADLPQGNDTPSYVNIFGGDTGSDVYQVEIANNLLTGKKVWDGISLYGNYSGMIANNQILCGADDFASRSAGSSIFANSFAGDIYNNTIFGSKVGIGIWHGMKGNIYHNQIGTYDNFTVGQGVTPPSLYGIIFFGTSTSLSALDQGLLTTLQSIGFPNDPSASFTGNVYNNQILVASDDATSLAEGLYSPHMRGAISNNQIVVGGLQGGHALNLPDMDGVIRDNRFSFVDPLKNFANHLAVVTIPDLGCLKMTDNTFQFAIDPHTPQPAAGLLALQVNVVNRAIVSLNGNQASYGVSLVGSKVGGDFRVSLKDNHFGLLSLDGTIGKVNLEMMEGNFIESLQTMGDGVSMYLPVTDFAGCVSPLMPSGG